jgi:hypothetical protein
MKKMMKWSGVFTAAVLLFAFTGEAGAFCVHNYSDKTAQFVQSSGGKAFREFKATLTPGQDSCCHWSNTDCNKDGGKMDTLGFDVGYEMASTFYKICFGVKIPACSDLDVTGSNGNYRCVAHGMETCN